MLAIVTAENDVGEVTVEMTSPRASYNERAAGNVYRRRGVASNMSLAPEGGQMSFRYTNFNAQHLEPTFENE